MSADRLAAARDRLADALHAGQDTVPFRRALSQIEADMIAADAITARRAAATEAKCAAAIRARASALAADCQHEAAAGVCS